MTQPVPAHQRAAAILGEIRGVRSLSGIDERSVQFLRGLVDRGVNVASHKQAKWLDDLECKAFGNRKEEVD